MPITEDDVKKAVETWLKQRGFKDVKARFGKIQGFDVEGVSPSGKRLVVECKGETKAPKQWDRAWRNVSQALFNESRKPKITETWTTWP